MQKINLNQIVPSSTFSLDKLLESDIENYSFEIVIGYKTL